MHKNANPLENQALTENPKNDLACCLALLTEKDPDLALVIEAWPKLPEHIKQALQSVIGNMRYVT